MKEHLFSGDRLARVLEALVERQASQDHAMQDRRASLERELGDLRQSKNFEAYVVHSAERVAKFLEGLFTRLSCILTVELDRKLLA